MLKQEEMKSTLSAPHSHADDMTIKKYIEYIFLFYVYQIFFLYN